MVMHKLGIQFWPSPDVMALMRTKAALNIALEDTHAYCTVKEFATGFKTAAGFPDVHQAEQRLARCWHLDLHFKRKASNCCTLSDMMALMGTLCNAAMLSMSFEGHTRILHGRGDCGWLQEVPGFPDARHQTEQRLVTRGHLDHRTECWLLLHIKRRDGAHGR